MTRRAAVPLAALGLLAAPSALAQTAVPDYRSMFVQYGGKTVQAKLGSYCHPNAQGTGECLELDPKKDYPLKDAATITVRQGEDVTLLFKHTVSHLAWRAARIDGLGEERITWTGTGRAVTKTFRRWKIKLPRTMARSSDVLGFDVNYPNAYSSFEVRIKVLKARAAAKK
ncbi:hypothetical protein [Conexibacter sp. SYSU D00693]|uniref:hypothetical protein n=1 Tax=Conexibacter sp. SYSU D00693 TaxID=2812560 RepID=UPI00196A888A|nr:hypothetical protein [Conexibacter sp. SYSU D00693]